MDLQHVVGRWLIIGTVLLSLAVAFLFAALQTGLL